MQTTFLVRWISPFRPVKLSIREKKQKERKTIKTIFDTGWMGVQTKPEMAMLILERDLFSPGE